MNMSCYFYNVTVVCYINAFVLGMYKCHVKGGYPDVLSCSETISL